MIEKLVYMNGYGFYVWASFGVVFLSCFIFFLKTLRKLKKYESLFVKEVTELSKQEKKSALSKSETVGEIFKSGNKTI